MISFQLSPPLSVLTNNLLILSAGIFADFAFSIASLNDEFAEGSLPPLCTAIVISLDILVNIF